MKLLFDTCVLYPTVMREMLMGTMEISGDTPFWSERILEEWARAARKICPTGEAQARGEIALLRARWPKAEAIWAESLEARLWLPDEQHQQSQEAGVSESSGSDHEQSELPPRGLLSSVTRSLLPALPDQ